jgi:class I fructose-bisphosphate aldolase
MSTSTSATTHYVTDRVREILSYYPSDNPGTKTNLARLMMHGRLAGTGRLVILPVDQGFEHGPYRSFGINQAGMDPDYHFRLGIESGCSAYAAPLGFLEAGAGNFAGDIPLILKLNNSDSLAKVEPISALTGSVRDALRLGCVGIGFTIYPGSGERNAMYEQFQRLIAEAKEAGLLSVVWSYPRGSGLSKEGEQSLDVISYGAHIAAQLGAHIVKVKLPKDRIEQPEAQKVYDAHKPARESLAERVSHVVSCTFAGKRIVIFSGGESKESASAVLDDARAIRAGGGYGSIIGRNSFQRPFEQGKKLLQDIMDIYK